MEVEKKNKSMMGNASTTSLLETHGDQTGVNKDSLSYVTITWDHMRPHLVLASSTNTQPGQQWMLTISDQENEDIINFEHNKILLFNHFFF